MKTPIISLYFSLPLCTAHWLRYKKLWWSNKKYWFFVYLLHLSGTRHAKMLAMLYAIDVEGFLLFRWEKKWVWKWLFCSLTLHLNATVCYGSFIGLSFSPLGFISHNLMSILFQYLAWKRGVRSFKARYLLHSLLGFIRNFKQEESIVGESRKHKKEKKRPILLSWTPVWRYVIFFIFISWNYIYLLCVLFWRPMMVSWKGHN